LISLVIILVILNIIDILTTCLIFDFYHISYEFESNPLLSSLFTICNTSLIIIPFKALLLGFLLFIVFNEKKYPVFKSVTVSISLLILNFVYFYAMVTGNIPFLLDLTNG
jgi:Domain of unknown function (DUF5658)